MAMCHSLDCNICNKVYYNDLTIRYKSVEGTQYEFKT